MIMNDSADAIRAANDRFVDAFNRGDTEGLAGLYTAEGQVLPPGGDVITGKAGIQVFWQALVEMGIKSAKLETLELNKYTDTAVEVGKYTLGGEDDQVLDQGKYIVIWRQEDGQWKLHRDIFNTSIPAKDN
jgi:uncharacterized protein (TIGR02246 family)